MKTAELRTKSVQDLQIHIGELREQLHTKKVESRIGSLKETASIRTLKREIAVCKTLIAEMAKANN